MPTAIITTDDLREFKLELLQEIKELLDQKGPKTERREFLRSTQVMEMLNISSGTLQGLRINGTLPFIKIGGLIFYEAGQIERILMENLVSTKVEKQ